MLDGFVQLLFELIQQHGVLAVMLGMVIEEVFVPIPSPIIPMAAGFLLIEAATVPAAVVKVLFIIAIPASIASVLSSYFVFGAAYYGGPPIIKKYGKYLDVKWEEVQHLESHFDSGREKYYVALFRAVPIVPLSLISGSAGLFQMDWREYGIWSFIGMMPRNFILGMIGWWVGSEKYLERIAGLIDSLSTLIIVTVILAVGSVIAYRKARDLYIILIEKSA
ncbi:hypothetical protein GKQ38_02885 [Candidatus Nanohaloarchaea archaeon]|nr:hypothetical protein GKQ38_02885 [Candidatus Nanohaloarchaea archaeon]